jgi:hypothetical protein
MGLKGRRSADRLKSDNEDCEKPGRKRFVSETEQRRQPINGGRSGRHLAASALEATALMSDFGCDGGGVVVQGQKKHRKEQQ